MNALIDRFVKWHIRHLGKVVPDVPVPPPWVLNAMSALLLASMACLVALMFWG